MHINYIHREFCELIITYPTTATISLISDFFYGRAVSPPFSGIKIFKNIIIWYVIWVTGFKRATGFDRFNHFFGPQQS